MFDLVTKTELRSELAIFKTELAIFKTEIECELLKLEARIENRLWLHTLAIIGAVTAVVTALHFWK